MKKTWLIIARILSGIQVAFGVFIIYINISLRYQLLNSIMQEPEYSWKDVSWFELFKAHQFMLLVSLLFIVSGFLLFRFKKIGWSASLAAWMVFGFTVLSLLTINDVTTTTMYPANSEYWTIGLVAAAVLGSIIFLLSKPIRKKYSVDKRSWFYAVLIILFFVLNKLLIG